MLTTIDTLTLITVTGGVRPGPNGEGCTQPDVRLPIPRPLPFPRPFPFPRPTPL